MDEALHQTNSLSDSVAQLNQSAESDHHVESPVDSEVRRIFRSRILAKAPRFTARLNMSQNSRSSSRLSAKRNLKRGICGPNTFTKEVVLLPDPTAELVPRRGTKQWLFDNGHVKNAVEFQKDWDAKTIMEHLQMVFQDKIDSTTQFEILMGLHNKVVKPNLVAGQTLSGFLIHKVFAAKALYLRPNKMLLQMPHDDTNKITNAYASDLQDESQKPLNNESHCEVHQTGEELHQEIPTLQLTNTDVICSTPFSDLGNYEVICSVSPLQLMTQTRTPPNPHSSCTATAEESKSSDPYHQYINILDLTQDDNSEAAILLDDNLIEPSHDGFLLEDILGNLAKAINDEEISIFNINRSTVWEGALRGFRRNTYSPTKRISVKFTDDVGDSEGAVDIGGPRREFLRLLMKHLQTSCLFIGPENQKHLCLNSSAVRSDDYFIAGRAIAVSLVHGGPPPRFLATELYDALVRGPENVTCDFQKIPDEDLKSKLEKIADAQSLEAAVDAVLMSQDFLSLAGCLRHVTSLEGHKQLVKEATNWYFFGRTSSAFERFKLGLSTLDVLDAIRKFPQAFQPAFCHTETKLTSQEIDQMFSIVMESQGSNKRQTQSKVTGWWRDYLIDAQEEETGVSLGEILAFATGTDYPPALGWETKPSIEFIYSSDLLPTANTCANILRLPTVHKEYEDFKKNMDFAIQNSPGFGQA